jgi:hypothetical protein
MMQLGKTPVFRMLFIGLVVSAVWLAATDYCWSAGDFDVSVDVSRTSGVAPLSVFFDATGTPDLAAGSYVDATFAWNFDADNLDPSANYRTASGFVAAHVFENPGAYRVRVDVYDTLGRQAWEEVTITVQAFSGTTYYVAEDGSNANDGLSMDAPVRTVEYALRTLAQPNTRILFKKGDTFFTEFVSAYERPGPVIVAAYEDPDDPSNQAPVIYNTEADSAWSTITPGNDWRIMDLRIRSGGCTAGEDGTPRYPGGVAFGNNTNNSLMYRLEQDQLSGGWMAPYGTYNTVAECDIHDVSSTGYSSGGEGGALIGNRVHDKCTQDPEHTYRLQGGTRYFIAFNNLEGNVVHYDSLTIRGNTDKVVIYKNTLDRVTGIWPQVRNSYEEYQHHCILDANLFMARNYAGASNTRGVALGLHARDIVIRNNIFYDYASAINIEDDTVVGPSQRIKVYNNTFINMTADSSFYFVNIDPACSDIVVKNNAILDNAGSTAMYTRILRDRSVGNTLQGVSNRNIFFGADWDASMVLFNTYDLAGWQAASGQDLNSRLRNPELAGLDPDSANFALPLDGSPLINAGDFTGGALDYHGNVRDLSHDIGAVEFISSAVDAESPTAPAGLVAAAISAGQVDLSWSAATDNTGVAGYRIFRDGEQVGTAVDTAFGDTGCQAGTSYTFTVKAFDAAGNLGPASNEAAITTARQATGTDTGEAGGSSGGCFLSAL